MNVVHPDHLAQQFDAVQVVHSQDGAPLVFVAEEAKTLKT
jgi:hypothetical protein